MNITVSQLIPVADMIARTFGSDCEVVLHDLTHPRSSVVYTANGHVTGREVGQSFDHLITHVLLSKDFKDDVSANYYFQTEGGTLIRSSTALIKDDAGVVVGAICVNLDTSADIAILRRLQEQFQNLPDRAEKPGRGATVPAECSPFNAGEESPLLPGQPSGPAKRTEPPEFLGEHIIDMADHLIDQIVGGQDASQMQRDEKVQMVRFMYEKGLFLIKGTIERVAEKLGVSKVTIYSYLDEIKNLSGQG